MVAGTVWTRLASQRIASDLTGAVDALAIANTSKPQAEARGFARDLTLGSSLSFEDSNERSCRGGVAAEGNA